ncbi:hypothetical protein niasHT_020259 [Heterodera trifolii]|uniref:histone acetyltransferase n=1 Tax=Heterodera trifolii TaxID=157864 RepID=A0ABD2KSL5_9BILA
MKEEDLPKYGEGTAKKTPNLRKKQKEFEASELRQHLEPVWNQLIDTDCLNIPLPDERINLNVNTPDEPNWIPKSMFQKKIDMEPFEHYQICDQKWHRICWASPPDEGVDYIFHCRPTQQKAPTPQWLEDWYKTMLNNGREKGIVYEYTDIFHTERDAGLDTPMKLPYFEGDYWPRIIDECIRAAEKQGITVMAKLFQKLVGNEEPNFTFFFGIALLVVLFRRFHH